MNNKLTINKSIGMFIFIIIPFFRPLGLEVKSFHFLYSIFTAWELLVILFLLVMFFSSSTKWKIKKKDECRFIKLYLIYTFVQSMLIRVLRGNDVIPFFSVLFYVSGVAGVILLANRNYKRLLDFFYWYFFAINILNFIFYFEPALNSLLGDEWYYFSGHRQSLPMLWAISLFVSLVKYFYEKNSRKPSRTLLLIYIVLPSLMMIVSGVSTGIIALMVFLMLYFVVIFKNKANSINSGFLRIVYIVGLIFNWLLVSVNIQTRFSTFLSIYLKQTTTLNGRVTIWESFLKTINQADIFGYGYNGVKVSTGWGGAWDSLDYAHNTILQELSNGGIVGLIIFVLMGFFALKSIDKIDNILYKKITLCVLGAQLVIMCSESMSYYLYYILFIVLLTFLPRLESGLDRRLIESSVS